MTVGGLLSKRLFSLSTFFGIPLAVLVSIVGAFIAGSVYHLSTLATVISLVGIIVGSLELIRDTVLSLLHRRFALDYIALLAICVSLVSREYLVGSVIVLMLAGGNALERYGTSLAKQSLSALVNRIPHQVTLWEQDHAGDAVSIATIVRGQHIVVRKGEVIPLDGTVLSDSALVDESTLTGEPYTVEKKKHDVVRSGTVNVGNMIVIAVTRPDRDSTYRKIIDMVKRAQAEKTPFIRLADRYSVVFTLITLTLAGCAYMLTQDGQRVLAVLVIATPCPLILATPIALLGGMNAAAKKRIIMKKLASIEVLSRVNAIIFDKTGTVTVGRPTLVRIERMTPSLTESTLLGWAAAIERNSLHPLAKALVYEASLRGAPLVRATHIDEQLGMGVSGQVGARRLMLAKQPEAGGMAIGLYEKNRLVATFHFEDALKTEAPHILGMLGRLGIRLAMYTGDKRSATKRVTDALGASLAIHTDCSPEEKKEGIATLKKQGYVTAMVGDGINDAPALASADVGLVFSSDEQTASTEAADVVILGGDIALVLESIRISKRTIAIARQSIFFGIGLSVVGMIAASFGMIPPLVGAGVQEVIDVAVILNALRAAR